MNEWSEFTEKKKDVQILLKCNEETSFIICYSIIHWSSQSKASNF